jgi:hypothetical protein
MTESDEPACALQELAKFKQSLYLMSDKELMDAWIAEPVKSPKSIAVVEVLKLRLGASDRQRELTEPRGYPWALV